MTFSAAAFKGFAVDFAQKVDHQNVALLCGTLFGDFDCRPVALGDILQCFLHIVFASLEGRLFNFQLAQVGHFDVRHYFTAQRGRKVLTLFILSYVHTGLAGELQRIAFNRLTGAFVEGGLDRVTLHLGTKSGFHNRKRHLARTKSRHFHGLSQFSQLYIHRSVDFFGRNHNRVFTNKPFGFDL